jgi:hypothetical protein
MSHWDSGRPAHGQHDVPRPSWPDGMTYPFPLPLAVGADDEIWLAGGSPGGGWPPDDDGLDDDEHTAPYPLTYERDEFFGPPSPPPAPPRESYHPWPPAPYPAFLRNAAQDTRGRTDSGAGREPRGRRWLVLAGIVVAAATVGASAVLLKGGHPAAQGPGDLAAPAATPAIAAAPTMAATVRPSTPPSLRAGAGAPLTVSQAQAVLAKYAATNNSANAQRSDTLLATVESGSSYAIDAGLYLTQTAAGAAPYPAFSPVQATYYIARGESATGPRWFVVQVANAFQSNPAKVTSDEYLLFTQSAPGGAWQDTIEPYLLPASSAPRIKVDADGLATAVSPGAGSVTVAPGQLPAVTAASFDGAEAGQAAIVDPGNLADRGDQRFWQAKVRGGQVSDTHAAAAGAAGQEFALLTTDGGALVFYTDAAELTITPRAGKTLHVTIPGLYSSGQGISRARVSYLEQLAAYDPPAAAGGTPRIVADYSAVTGKG